MACTLTATASGGVATFSKLILDTAGSYTLGEKPQRAALPDSASASFTSCPGGGESRGLRRVQPSTATAGMAISPAVTVKAFDQFGNFASNDNSDQVTPCGGQRAGRLHQRQHLDGHDQQRCRQLQATLSLPR